MSLAPGVTGPLNACRRLFGEATYTRVQQTMEAVIRKDAERFAKVWNFPIVPVDTRRPLVQRSDYNSVSSKSNDPKIPGAIGWQQIQPEATFYTTPPRKLKAFRRLTPSVAQKTRAELLRLQEDLISIPSDSVEKSSSETLHNIEESVTANKEETIIDLFQPIQNVNRSQSGPVPSEQSVKRSAPIIIRPSSTDSCLPLPYLEQVKMSETVTSYPFTPESSPKSRLTIVRCSRHSEQSIKRKSGTRVTDYFTVSKRARPSLK